MAHLNEPEEQLLQQQQKIGTWKIAFYERLKLQVVNDYKILQKREYEEQF